MLVPNMLYPSRPWHFLSLTMAAWLTEAQVVVGLFFLFLFFCLRNFAVNVNKMCSVHKALQPRLRSGRRSGIYWISLYLYCVHTSLYLNVQLLVKTDFLVNKHYTRPESGCSVLHHSPVFFCFCLFFCLNMHISLMTEFR